MPSYWIVVGSPDNFEKTAELGFTVQGLKSRHRRKAERMDQGDRLVWYITGDQAFAGIATIQGPYFEDAQEGRQGGRGLPVACADLQGRCASPVGMGRRRGPGP